eukprot:7055580-Karenia_brevis.AAC.1
MQEELRQVINLVGGISMGKKNLAPRSSDSCCYKEAAWRMPWFFEYDMVETREKLGDALVPDLRPRTKKVRGIQGIRLALQAM